MPEPSVDICIGALPAATFNTAKLNEKKKKRENEYIYLIKILLHFIYYRTFKRFAGSFSQLSQRSASRPAIH